MKNDKKFQKDFDYFEVLYEWIITDNTIFQNTFDPEHKMLCEKSVNF